MPQHSGNALRATLATWWHAVLRFVTGLLGQPASTPGDALPPSNAAPQGAEESVAGGSFIPINELQCLDNFYRLEDASGVGSWRWTGPGCSFSLFAPTARDRDQTIVIEALGTLAAINWSNTFLEVEEDMMLCEHKEVDGRHWLTALLPARPQSHGAFIRYHIQDCRHPPVNDDGSRDGRKLGLSLTGLRLIPA